MFFNQFAAHNRLEPNEQTQILFKERAQILSAASSAIKKDRAAFTTLVKEANRITGAGNKLVTERTHKGPQKMPNSLPPSKPQPAKKDQTPSPLPQSNSTNGIPLDQLTKIFSSLSDERHKHLTEQALKILNTDTKPSYE